MQNALNTAMLGGKEFEVTGYVRLKGENEVIPVVDIPQMSDYKYQLMNLKSRIEHPERYEESENISEAKEDLKKWLLERTTTRLYLELKDEFKECYKYIFQRRGKANAAQN